MRSISLFIALSLVLGFIGCDRYPHSNPIDPDYEGATIEAPTLVQPDQDAWFWNKTGSIKFSWSDPLNAPQYQIQIGKEPDFSGPDLDETVSSASYDWSDFSSSKYYWRVRAWGEVGDWSTARSFEVLPYEIGGFRYGAGWGVSDVALSENLAFLLLGGGLWVVDVSDPSNPLKVGVLDVGSSNFSIFVSSPYAYIVDSSYLYVIDVSNPLAPSIIGRSLYIGIGSDIYVSSSYAYVALQSGLRVLEASDPDSIKKVAYNNEHGANSVFVVGNYAYVTDKNDGLWILDVSQPSNPTTVSFTNTGGLAADVYVSDDYAYVADGDRGLEIINVSDPANPQRTGSVNIDGKAQRVFVLPPYAYVTTRYSYPSKLSVIDISDPLNAVEVSYLDLSYSDTHCLYVSGTYAYIGGYEFFKVVKLRPED